MTRRHAPSYLTMLESRGGYHVKFRYIDSLGGEHWLRERSPYPQDLRRSIEWAPQRRLELIRDIEDELRRVEVRRAIGITVGEVMDAYETDARERGTRWEGSEACRAAVLRATLGEKTPVAQLSVERIVAWRRELRGRRGEARPLSSRSLNAYTTLLQAALNLAVRLGTLETNPLARLRRLPQTRREPPALAERQVAALMASLPAWEAAHTSRDERRWPRVDLTTRVMLGYYTGGRPEAIDALRWRQVDLRRAVIRYDSKGHAAIVVPSLDRPLLARLRALHARLRPAGDDLVMPSSDGGGVVTSWRYQWRALLQFANEVLPEAEQIPLTRPIHCLRHSRITHLLLAGVSAQAVAQLTGTSVVMLHRHYAHILTDSLADELARARRHRSLQTIDRAASPVPKVVPKRGTKPNARREMTRSVTSAKLRIVR